MSTDRKTMWRGWLPACSMLTLLAATAAAATQDEDWAETGWQELDGKPPAPSAERPMAMGPHTLPAGRLAARTSFGLLYWNAGFQAGVLDWLDLHLELLQPYSDFGNTWLVGGGPKVRIFQEGKFASAFSLRLYGSFYTSAGQEVEKLTEGLGVGGTFQIGMTVKEGCFYGELGVLLWPYTSDESLQRRLFGGLPMRIGGEIFLTGWLPVFINVDLVLAGPATAFTMVLAGPTNLVELGVVFLS